MEIDGLLWSEIQEIRIAIKKHKENEWDKYKKMFRKGLTFEQIQKARNDFDTNRNQFTIEGRCNKVLEVIQKKDSSIIGELEEKKACKKCIKAYRLPKELLGKNKDKCYWCCEIIWHQ